MITGLVSKPPLDLHIQEHFWVYATQLSDCFAIQCNLHLSQICVACIAGIDGDFYSLVSDRDHLLNARLVKHGMRLDSDGVRWIDPPHVAQEATWMDTIGLTYKDDTVQVQSFADGCIEGDSIMKYRYRQTHVENALLRRAISLMVRILQSCMDLA